MGALIGDKPEREDREEVAMLRFLVVAALAAVVSSEADPQYFINPYYTPYQPVVSYYPQPQYPQYQVVPTVAEPKEDKTTDLKPTLYDAQPGFLTQIPKGSGKYLPDLFGWERGPDYFSKWNKVPVQLRNNRVGGARTVRICAMASTLHLMPTPTSILTSTPTRALIRAERRERQKLSLSML